MTSQEALEIIEYILPPGTLTSVKTLVFHYSWNGKEYRAIAKEAGYDDCIKCQAHVHCYLTVAVG